ncbi:MAG: hypothetical protein ABIR80_05770 [Opitutaceae bacterium]
MPKPVALAGWKTSAAGPKRQQSRGSDFVGASARVLKSKSKTAADSAAKPASKSTTTKLRAVYMRPAKGSDADAKLVIVDRKNRPVIVQG